MKFLKLVFDGKTKKIVFKPEYNKLETLKEAVSQMIGFSQQELVLEFTDLEEQTIELVDDFDLEYFIESEEKSINSTLKASKKATPETTLDFIPLEEKKVVEGTPVI